MNNAGSFNDYILSDLKSDDDIKELIDLSYHMTGKRSFLTRR